MASRRKLLIDVDTGVDDAQAIMMALASKDVDVLAITCVGGNTELDQVITNTLRVLKVCDRLDVPVHRGASKSLLGEVKEATYFHGADGMGGKPDPSPPSLDLVHPKPAPMAMVDIVTKYPGEVTLVALAPLTNIALAQSMDPNFGSKLKNAVIMGGNNLLVEGQSLRLEFNFRMDPEAAKISLSELKCPLQLLTWETCGEAPLEWEWFDNLMNVKTKKGIFHRIINEEITKTRKEVRKAPAYTSCDPTAMAIALDPNIVLSEESVHGTVELRHESLRGNLLLDKSKNPEKAPNLKLIGKLDCKKLRQIYESFLL